jgi:RHS repeat-associated protein
MPSLADSRHGKRRPRALSPTIVSMSVRPQRNSPNQKTLPICHYDESWIHLRQQSATCPNVQSFGSHLSGKERDTESGNDYFGARYYASSMGRFMSPDWSAKATPVPYAKLSNPQSLNLYAYVFNNPLGAADPDGHWVPLNGDDAARQKQLNGLKSAVGAQAGAYLYDNVVDGKHYVGIYSNGPDGKGPSFGSINGVSKQFGAIIGDQGREASIQFVSPGTVVGTKNPVKVGPTDAGLSPAATTFSKDGRTATVSITSGGFGELNGSYTSDGHSTWNTLGDILSHEFGHIDSSWYNGGNDTNGNSIRMENGTRQMEGGSIRMFHSKPGDVGATTF